MLKNEMTWICSTLMTLNIQLPFCLSVLSFVYSYKCISVLNDPLSQIQNCVYDIIQVAQFHAACCKKLYACRLLTNGLELKSKGTPFLPTARSSLFWFCSLILCQAMKMILDDNSNK